MRFRLYFSKPAGVFPLTHTATLVRFVERNRQILPDWTVEAIKPRFFGGWVLTCTLPDLNDAGKLLWILQGWYYGRVLLEIDNDGEWVKRAPAGA